jgi:hypothetical protein
MVISAYNQMQLAAVRRLDLAEARDLNCLIRRGGV